MVNSVMTPSDMAYVLILDVFVIINALETVNKYVVEIGLSLSTQSVSRQTVNRYQASKLKPGSGFERVGFIILSRLAKFLTFFCVLVPVVLLIYHVLVTDNRHVVEIGLSPSTILVKCTHKAI